MLCFRILRTHLYSSGEQKDIRMVLYESQFCNPVSGATFDRITLQSSQAEPCNVLCSSFSHACAQSTLANHNPMEDHSLSTSLGGLAVGRSDDDVPAVREKLLAVGLRGNALANFPRGALVDNVLGAVCNVLECGQDLGVRVLVITQEIVVSFFCPGRCYFTLRTCPMVLERAPTSLHIKMAELYEQLTREQLPGPGPKTGVPDTWFK